MESKKALLIGVSNYASFPTLKFCEKDAMEMATLLGGDPLGYDVVSLIGKVSSEEMRDTIRNFFLGEVNSKDTLVFYFSGHGVMDRLGKNHYLASSQIDPRDPGGIGFWFNELDQVIEDSISKRKVIMLDCCYSGALGNRGYIGLQKGSEEDAKKGAAEIGTKIRSGIGTLRSNICVFGQARSRKHSSWESQYLHPLLS